MFRPMRRHGQQLSAEQCEEILRTAPRGVLAVIGDEGYPYAVPLDFVLEDNTLYFHSATEGHKLDAIASCDKASFCVLGEGRREEGDWWYHFDSVICFGRMRVVDDDATRRHALTMLGNKYFPEGYDTEGEIVREFARVAVLALTIEHLSGKHVREK